MYLLILIGLFILRANGIAIPNIAFILTFAGICLGILQGYTQALAKQKEQQLEQKKEYLRGYFDGIAKKGSEVNG